MSKNGLRQALMLVGYISLVGMFFTKANDWYGSPDPIIAPVMFLTLFVVSALVSGLIVFYKPYLLFMADKKKEAAALVVSTTVWLLIFAVILLTAGIWI